MLLLISTFDVVFMISLFTPITNSDGDLTNWIILIISGLFLLIVPILITKEISKSASNAQAELLKNLFKITHYLQKKEIFKEKMKLISIHNDMCNLKSSIFIHMLRKSKPLDNLNIPNDIVESYTKNLEQHYDNLLCFNEKTASSVRFMIKDTLRRINKVNHNDNDHIFTHNNCISIINFLDFTDSAFEGYMKTIIPGIGGGFPSDLINDLEIDLIDNP